MCQQVFLEVTFPCAFVLTLIAAEGLLPAMLPHVNFEVTSLSAFVVAVTLVSFVSLFPTMYLQMSPQIAYPRGCKITQVALV